MPIEGGARALLTVSAFSEAGMHHATCFVSASHVGVRVGVPRTPTHAFRDSLEGLTADSVSSPWLRFIGLVRLYSWIIGRKPGGGGGVLAPAS